MSETVLWTNPSPTSSFAAQTITLSQSIENFEYIKVTYLDTISTAKVFSRLIPTADTYRYITGTSSDMCCCVPRNGATSSGITVLRLFKLASLTTIKMDNAVRSNSMTTSDNDSVVPQAIYGLK